jgi:hypothetical protein
MIISTQDVTFILADTGAGAMTTITCKTSSFLRSFIALGFAVISIAAFAPEAEASERYIMRGGGTSILYDVRKHDGSRHHYVERCGSRWYFDSQRAKDSFLTAGFGGLKAGHVSRVKDGKIICTW